VNRRGFLLTLAAGAVAALTACDPDPRAHLAGPSSAASPTTLIAPPTLNPVADPTSSTPPLPVAQTSLPDVAGTWTRSPDGRPPSFLNSLPGSGRDLALTVDDGIDSAVVGSYLDFVESTGIRMTFFVNGVNPSWTEHASRLQPLVEAGQVQIGNHTWSHPDITKLSDRALADEVTRNDTFITKTYGVDARPYFRPPFGYRTARTDRVLAELGYTTQTMWYGSFGDSGLITEAQLMSLARQWLLPQHIVIGHANHPTVTRLFTQLADLISERQLRLVTLDDVFAAPHSAVSH
jgi:peptidoglycan/xylan/chitin deacetylase (PgdA/CDA1 family)